MAVEAGSGAEQLDRTITHLEARAEQLAQERMGILEMVRELRTERDRMGIEYVTVRPQETPRFAASELARVADWLNANAGRASSEVADALDVPQERAAKLLLELEKRDIVKRTGIKRGTRWWPADRAPVEQQSGVSDMRGTILAAARRLDTFTFAEIAEELSHLSEPTIRRWLQTYEMEEKIERERVGTSNLYSYVPPEQKTVNRAKRTTPEQDATRHQKRVARAQGPSGRRIRTGNKRSDELLAKAVAQGAIIVGLDGNNHAIVTKDGKTTRVSMTPGGAGNTNRRKLEELGVRL
jgi:DNA-binding Lrp family transcriptional regulator